MAEDSVEIIEGISVKSQSVLIGFPDVGLVGLISCMHIIETLKLPEKGHIQSELFPPLVVMHGGKFQSPVRIYSNDEITVVISEIPIPPTAIFPLAKALVKWLKTKSIKNVISLYGIPVPNRLNIENPATFANSNNIDHEKLLKDKDIKSIDTGILAGMHAAIIWEAIKQDLPIIALGVETFAQYPDPQASANLVTDLNKIIDSNIDIKELMEKAEELRIKLRDVMARTQETMPKQVPGMSPVDLPAMYG
ncbi:MAG: proteasome assembly chaperone family protein [Candidatus Helarchaeota archaeon]|nr:proteasome assembly chaperone family protein [Candidatus Helarchaeota archaeon]